MQLNQVDAETSLDQSPTLKNEQTLESDNKETKDNADILQNYDAFREQLEQAEFKNIYRLYSPMKSAITIELRFQRISSIIVDQYNYPMKTGSHLCNLCNQRDTSLGPMIFVNEGGWITGVHLACVAYTSRLKTDDYKFTNFIEVMDWARNNKCHLCKKYGASLECAEECNKHQYHLNCFFIRPHLGHIESGKKEIRCSSHKKKKLAKYNERISRSQRI